MTSRPPFWRTYWLPPYDRVSVVVMPATFSEYVEVRGGGGGVIVLVGGGGGGGSAVAEIQEAQVTSQAFAVVS